MPRHRPREDVRPVQRHEVERHELREVGPHEREPPALGLVVEPRVGVLEAERRRRARLDVEQLLVQLVDLGEVLREGPLLLEVQDLPQRPHHLEAPDRPRERRWWVVLAARD